MNKMGERRRRKREKKKREVVENKVGKLLDRLRREGGFN